MFNLSGICLNVCISVPLESGLMSLPDAKANKRASKAGFTLALGVAKSVASMKVNDVRQ